ncbi:MAG: hypothetical protein R2742_01010 [Micropruina glycogenica]
MPNGLQAVEELLPPTRTGQFARSHRRPVQQHAGEVPQRRLGPVGGLGVVAPAHPGDLGFEASPTWARRAATAGPIAAASSA